MILQQSSQDILSQLISLIESMEQHEYTAPIDALSKSSIGAHVRHIIEFYQCLIDGIKSGDINYDLRQRNLMIEEDKYFAQKCLLTIIDTINLIESDHILKITINLSKENSPVIINTSFFRELAYNIEHAIHHMAIVRIGIKTTFPSINMTENLGLAYSTINYNNQSNK